ncbi:MAG: TadE family protein [Beijerinckiaceae bacterium]
MPASVAKRLRQFAAAARGVAGVELALTAPFFAVGLVNAVDVGYYAYRRMQVENAAEIGAQAAWKACTDPKDPMVPVTTKCAGLNATITTAIQSTSLGTAVSLASGYPKEDYYCVTSSNALQYQGSVASTPTACSGGETPGDYIQVGVTYPYNPLFSGVISVMSASGITTITKTTWMRMG